MVIAALARKQTAQFLTTLTLVNAIIQVGNVIAASVSGGSASGQDNLKKVLTSLRELLLPEDVEEKESAAQRAMRLLKLETDKGPLLVTPKAVSKKAKGRIRRQVT